MPSGRPTIAVAGRIDTDGSVTVGAAYLDALRRAGAEPVVVSPFGPVDAPAAHAAATGALATADGLLLPGGPDIDPGRYGAPAHPRTYGIDPDRDTFEAALLHAALGAGLPVLAICRGMQLVNVEFGGTLQQHLPDVPGLLPHAPATFPRPAGTTGPMPDVVVTAGSRLHALLGGGDAGELVVNGAHRHHQAAVDVGPPLVVTARCVDGVVEAVEHPGHWLVGVQWHAEDGGADDATTSRLFAGLVSAAGDAGRRRSVG